MKLFIPAISILLFALGILPAKAAEAYRMESIGLLQQSPVLDERMPEADPLADYIKQINATIAKRLQGVSHAASAGGSIFIALRPGNRSKAWLGFDPALPPKVADILIAGAQSIHPPDVKGGTFIFCINVSLWGGPAPSSTGPNPAEWDEALRQQGHDMQADDLVDLIWPKQADAK